MRLHKALFVFAVASIARAAIEFDFVVIGGGTAGLTIASRLSEDANVTVVVLEAGEDRSEDINVLAPGLLTSLYGKPEYDWDYHTVPQRHANNHIIAQPRGKQLGGSSAINFLWWTHASRQDIDNWSLLGNANWSWGALDPFFTKSEHFVAPSAATDEALQTEYIDPEVHGQDGPILNTFADIYAPLDEVWPRTYEALGLAVDGDPRDGVALGGYTNLINMDPKTRSRSYAATTDLRQARDRPSFQVWTGAHVEKILFDRTSRRPEAVGVQYTQNGTSRTVKAKKEIVLSAGTFGSPQILELSGIGDPAVLKQHGVEFLVANDKVGENLQDHAYVPLGFRVKEPGVFTLDDFANETLFETAYEQYAANRTGLLATTSASSALLSLRQIVNKMTAAQLGLDDAIRQTCSNHSRNHHHELRRPSHDQTSIICRDLHTEAIAQELSIPGGINPQLSNDSSQNFLASTAGNFFSMLGVLEHPLSRGSVHIRSSNASVYPRIDPNYLSHDLDVKILSTIALHLQVVATTPPLSNLLVNNGTTYQPGYHKLDVENVETWVRDNLQSEHHPCGTCAMLPRGKGGVVDDRFRVYGVDGLRVVDASIFPLIPRANLQTLVYAVAERAVDFIRDDM